MMSKWLVGMSINYTGGLVIEAPTAEAAALDYVAKMTKKDARWRWQTETKKVIVRHLGQVHNFTFAPPSEEWTIVREDNER